MTFTEAQGKALFDGAGDIFFLARFALPNDSTGGVVMRNTGDQLRPVMRTGERGPEGGLIRSLSRPSVSTTGDLAIRLGFEPFTGGVAGVYLKRPGDSAFASYLRLGEGGDARVGGRITGLNPKVSLNRDDRLAFLANVGGGTARSVLFLAAPAALDVQQLAIRRGPTLTNRDRLRVSAVLEPGTLPPPPQDVPAGQSAIRPRTVSVTVADSVGPLWSGTLSSTDMRVRRRTLIGEQGKGGRIADLRLRFLKNGTMRIALRSQPFDLSLSSGLSLDRRFDDAGGAILVPPFFVRVDAGEDGASGRIDCTARRRKVRCGS
jgi:hypothetical protein